MRTELITIETDTIPIEGLYYEPEGKIKGAALFFHGNTMNFYTGAAKFLAPALTKQVLLFLLLIDVGMIFYRRVQAENLLVVLFRRLPNHLPITTLHVIGSWEKVFLRLS